MSCSPCRIAIFGAVAFLALASRSPAEAQELLQNGGFEQGTSGWNGLAISTTGCLPRSGSKALAISNFAQQNIPALIGSGNYSLAGWLKAQSVSGSATVSLTWLDASESELTQTSKSVSAGPDYTLLSVNVTSPAGAQSLRVRITVGSGPVCLDDMSLDGPPPAPPTEPTPSPEASATSAPAQQSTAAATSTPKPDATAKPTTKPAAIREPTAVPAAPGFAFVNGGFEQGLDGWSKFGGTLGLIDAPVQSGAHAGRLTSNTDSTKWAYQVVLVDSSQFYEFGGYVDSDGGVSRAYLRISWYESGDGSGQAISTTDSTATIDGDGGGYVFLSTGSVAPPAGARSARPRVVMTPLGSVEASIWFDDLAFSVAAPPAVEADEPRPAAGGAQASSDSSGGTEAGPLSKPEAKEPSRTADVRAAISDPHPPEEPRPSIALSQPDNDSAGVPLVWIGAGLIFIAGLGGSYLRGKHTSPGLEAEGQPRDPR